MFSHLFVYQQYKSYALNPQVNTDLLRKKSMRNSNDRVVEHCISRLCSPADPVILCVEMILLLEKDYIDKGVCGYIKPRVFGKMYVISF